MIDFHTHLGNISFPRGGDLTAEQMIDTMNMVGISKSVLLPLECPEASSCYFTTFEAIKAWKTYPERFIPFCSTDPRRGNIEAQIKAYKDMGCVSYGEHKMGLAIDDKRCKTIYAVCNELKWTVVFHLDPGLDVDEVGLPRLEALLKEFPDMNFAMHGPGWWCEMSGDNQARGGYPKGKITPGGAVDRLLQSYPNIYGEISAGSGHNALTRDPDYTQGFLERNWKQLLFGTDYLGPGQGLPQVKFIRELKMDDEKVFAIARGNAMRLLNISASAFRKPFTR